MYIGVFKNRGKTPKMNGENNGSKPYEQMDDFGGFAPIFGLTPIYIHIYKGDTFYAWDVELANVNHDQLHWNIQITLHEN